MAQPNREEVQKVLASIDNWPVDHAAAMAFDGQQVYTHGDQDRVFPLASVSKLVTAYATIMAAEEGAFDLDDRVNAQFVPQFDTPPTIRELLSHASGVAFDQRTPNKPPRERRIYSSAGYEVLADQIERATEMDFADYVELGICHPLGISITIEGSAGHGFSASTSDMSALAQEFVAPQLLSEITVDEAMAVAYPELSGIVPGYGRYNPCPWGLGFEVHGQKTTHWMAESMPDDAVGHFGQSGTFLWVCPDERQAAVVLTDKNFDDWAKKRWSKFNSQLWLALGNSA